MMGSLQWVEPAEVAARRLCTRMPSRYLHGQVPVDDAALM